MEKRRKIKVVGVREWLRQDYLRTLIKTLNKRKKEEIVAKSNTRLK